MPALYPQIAAPGSQMTNEMNQLTPAVPATFRLRADAAGLKMNRLKHAQDLYGQAMRSIVASCICVSICPA
jgi:hypothetical protein